MHPTEIWWLIDAKMPPKMFGSLTQEQVEELIDLLPEMEKW